MRLAVTLSPEQALTVLREASAAPGFYPSEHVLDAAEVVLARWGVQLVSLEGGQWMWHENGDWSPIFESRQGAINDAVEQRMKPHEVATNVA